MVTQGTILRATMFDMLYSWLKLVACNPTLDWHSFFFTVTEEKVEKLLLLWLQHNYMKSLGKFQIAVPIYYLELANYVTLAHLVNFWGF